MVCVGSPNTTPDTSDARTKPFSSPMRRKRAKTSSSDGTSVITEACNILQSVNASRKTKDQYDIFGEYVASKIRNLKSDYAKATMQHEINNLLYFGDLGRYDNDVQVLCGDSSQGSALSTPADASNESVGQSGCPQEGFVNEVTVRDDGSTLANNYVNLLEVCGINQDTPT